MKILSAMFRVACVAFFAAALYGYWQRPDQTSIVGVCMLGVVTAVALYRPLQRPVRWQLLTALVVTPIAVLWETNGNSVAEKMVGDMMFGGGGAGVIVGLILGVTTIVLVTRGQPDVAASASASSTISPKPV